MALYIGQFLLTGKLLNRVAAPLLLERYRFLNDLSFQIVDILLRPRSLEDIPSLTLRVLSSQICCNLSLNPPFTGLT